MQATINNPSASYSPAHSGNSFQSVSASFLLAFIYLVYSRVPDFLPLPGVALIASILGLISALLTGNLLRAIKSRPGIVLLVFTAWACVGVPFSVWPGGAFSEITGSWLKAMLVYYIVASLVTFRDCRRAAHVSAFATLTILALIFRFGAMQEGRLSLGRGTLANPNDLATYLLAGAPFCIYTLLGSNKALKVFGGVSLGLIVVNVLKTGSRGALIGMVAGLVYVFATSKMVQRVMMLAGACVALVGILVVVPGDTLTRYSTIFSDSEGQDGAVASKVSRMRLLKTSLVVTLKHPVFGVGMGQFPVAGNEETRTTFGFKEWHVTHNMYTQVSSELGIPGFILYVSLLVIAFRSVGRVMRYAKNDPALSDAYRLAFALRVSWITFLVNGFFGSIAFSLPLLILFGLSEVLRTSVLPEDVMGNRAPVNPRRPVSDPNPRLPFQSANPAIQRAAGMPMLRSKHRAT